MEKILLFIITLIIASASTTKEIGYHRSTTIEIAVNDANCTDLLDPSNPNSFKEEEIKIFNLKGGVLEEVYNERMDVKRDFFIFEQDSKYGKRLFPNNEYLMRLFPNISASEKFPITYIQWNAEDTDTIQCQFLQDKNYFGCSKVWFNGEPVWDVARANHTKRSIEIVK